LRQKYVLTTTIPTRFFTGTMPTDTVDMQVSVNGTVFTADPDALTFEGSSFTLPNPSAFPEGLQLLPGRNVIRVRATLSTGSVTQEAVAEVFLSLEADLGDVAVPPTGVYLERYDDTVKIQVDEVEAETVVGYHFYGTPEAGGVGTSYFRINPSLVISGERVEALTDLGTLNVDADVVVDSEGDTAADPLLFRVKGTQEDRLAQVLGTDFDETLEIPETATRFRVTTTVQMVEATSRFSFIHDRRATLGSANPALPHAALASVPLTDPVYYVVTAVHVLEDGTEVESPFSPEVLGAPLRVTPIVGTFPQASRQQILREAVASIYRVQPQVRVDPGSALRDTFLDPFATEADRVRFVMDFLHNAQSFTTLLAIDDPSLSGTSIPVGQSGYKTALREAFFLTSDDDTQTIIDNCFDKLASNYGVIRDGGRRARGEVTFFVTTRPGSTINKAIGTLVTGGSASFRTTSTAAIAPTGGNRNYNPSTGRYFARAYILAESTGSAGNLAAGQIRVIPNNTLNVQVINESPTFGGTDRESNRDLAVRAMRVLASVDSGTLQGYKDTAINVAGVSEVSVIQSGHALMMRDRTTDGRHVGGKVDLYLRGSSTAKVTDSFAFSFEVGERVQFEPVGDLSSLRFRAIDPRLSEDFPIIEMLSLPNLGLEFENATRGYAFDITNVQILTYNQIQLSADFNDPTAHTLGDEIRGSFRYRTSNKFVLTRQPVIEVTSFEGTQTGEVLEGIYDLFRASDPLEMGRSTLAGDFIQVTEPLDEQGSTIPSGVPITVSGEEHILLEGIEYLENLGANPLTVRVWNLDRTIEYNGPYSNETRDFTLVQGSETVPLGFQRTGGSRLVEGQTVLVDYSHDENFTVAYTTNAVVSVVQGVVAKDSHITADAVVKWAVEMPVDISATIALDRNQDANRVDGRVRTALARLFGAFPLGRAVRQSDVIRAIDEVQGVSYVVTPLTKMVFGDTALVVRESVVTDNDSDFFQVAAWSSATVRVFLLKDPLSAATVSAGGARKEFRGVFQDEVRLGHNEVPPGYNGFPLRGAPGGAFIIGAEGLIVPGYSDDASIIANNVLPTNADKRAAEILRIRSETTGNRVLVSLPPLVPAGDAPDTPTLHDYKVTFTVSGDEGVKNLDPGPISYLVLGEMNFEYDEAS
jgi:uncharacterized phage protein gp47/JayE